MPSSALRQIVEQRWHSPRVVSRRRGHSPFSPVSAELSAISVSSSALLRIVPLTLPFWLGSWRSFSSGTALSSMPVLTGVVQARVCASFGTRSGFLVLNNALQLSRWADWETGGSGLPEEPESKADEGSRPLFCPSTWQKPASLRDGLKIKENVCAFAGWESITHTVGS